MSRRLPLGALVVTLLGWSVSVNAQTEAWRHVFESGDHPSRATAIATCLGGDVIIAGMFSGGEIRFGAHRLENATPPIHIFGGGIDDSRSRGNDVFLARISADGSVVRARHIGSSTGETITALVTDRRGRITLGGTYRGELSIGRRPLPTAEAAAAYIAQIEPGGRVRWVRSVGGRSISAISSLAIAADGSVAVTGVTLGTLVVGATTLPAANPEAPSADAFVAMLAPDGAPRWVVRAGGSFSEGLAGVVFAPGGDVIVAGDYRSNDLRWGTTTLPAPYGSNPDLVVARLAAADGSVVWLRTAGTNSHERATAAVAREDGEN